MLIFSHGQRWKHATKMSMRILGVRFNSIRHFIKSWLSLIVSLLYALMFLFKLKNESFIVVPRSPQTLNLCSKCYKDGKQNILIRASRNLM